MLNFFDTIPLPTIVVNKENKIIFINSIGLHFLESRTILLEFSSETVFLFCWVISYMNRDGGWTLAKIRMFLDLQSTT